MSFLDVKDCGAIGDGTTDDTTAIQDALDIGLQVYFPPGNYRITSALTLRSQHHLFGAGDSAKIFTTTNNINLISGTDVTDILVEKLRLVGNNTASDFANGNGIYFTKSSTGSQRLTVRDCHLEDFGSTANNAGCAINFYIGCEDITVDGCFITGGVGEVSVSDIIVNNYSGFAIITSNRCYSQNSQGIYVNVEEFSIGKIIIANNICRNHTRHGIQTQYSAPEYMDTIVDGNLCFNNGSSGVYMQKGAGGGSTVIANNVVDACGGGPEEQSSSLMAGIFVTATNPLVVANNHVINAGKDEEGDPRYYTAFGIRCANSGDMLIDGNVVEGCSGGGIMVDNVGANVSVSNNIAIDNASVNLRIEVSGATVQAMLIQGNQIYAKSVDADGLDLANLGSGAKNVSVTDNVIVGLKQDSGKIGLDYTWTGEGIVSNNIVQNWDIGVNFPPGPTYQLDGRIFFVTNRIVDNDLAVKYSFQAGPNDYGFLVNSWFAGNTTQSDASGGYANLRYALAIYPKKVFYDTGSPGNGTWAQGDTVINSTPSASGNIGWVCTTAGSPGTWKSFGTIAS